MEKPIILAADDVEINLNLLRSILEPNGYTLIKARSGKEAFAQDDKLYIAGCE